MPTVRITLERLLHPPAGGKLNLDDARSLG
jgi:hypothetical protein